MPIPYTRATVKHGQGRDTKYDELSVEIAVERGRMALHPLELREAVRRLDKPGVKTAEIAERLGTTCRTVQRHRAILRKLEQDGKG